MLLLNYELNKCCIFNMLLLNYELNKFCIFNMCNQVFFYNNH